MIEKSSQFYNSSVEKVIKIIENIANNKEQYLGISQISRLSGLDKSAVYRIINTLYSLGYLNKSNDAKYGLSVKFVILTNKILEKLNLRKNIEPYLNKISDFIKHFTTFSIIENNEVILIGKIDSEKTLRIHSEVGQTYPINCSASGKAYLSTLNDEEIDNLYSKIKLVKRTKNSITDLEKLKMDIENIKRRGYAINKEECDLYKITVAVPVKNISGKYIGSIGVSMPSVDITDKLIEDYGRFLKEISFELLNKLN